MLYSMWSLTVPVIIIHYLWKFPILIINKLTRPDWSGRKEVMMIWLSSLLSNCQISWQSNVLLFDFEIQKYDPVTLPFSPLLKSWKSEWSSLFWLNIVGWSYDSWYICLISAVEQSNFRLKDRLALWKILQRITD